MGCRADWLLQHPVVYTFCLVGPDRPTGSYEQYEKTRSNTLDRAFDAVCCLRQDRNGL